jgi:hypothetical protein
MDAMQVTRLTCVLPFTSLSYLIHSDVMYFLFYALQRALPLWTISMLVLVARSWRPTYYSRLRRPRLRLPDAHPVILEVPARRA